MNIGFRSAIGQMGHTVSAELISRSWKEARPDYTLNNRGRGAWLQAACGDDAPLTVFWNCMCRQEARGKPRSQLVDALAA